MTETALIGMLIAGRDDLTWFDAHIGILRAKYHDKFVAFHNGQVLDADTDVERLMKKLGDKGIDTSQLFIKFVSKVKAIL